MAIPPSFKNDLSSIFSSPTSEIGKRTDHSQPYFLSARQYAPYLLRLTFLIWLPIILIPHRSNWLDRSNRFDRLNRLYRFDGWNFWNLFYAARFFPYVPRHLVNLHGVKYWLVAISCVPKFLAHCSIGAICSVSKLLNDAAIGVVKRVTKLLRGRTVRVVCGIAKPL